MRLYVDAPFFHEFRLLLRGLLLVAHTRIAQHFHQKFKDDDEDGG